MRYGYGMHGWFVIGALVPVLAIVLVPLVRAAASGGVSDESVLILGVSGTVAAVLVRVIAGGLRLLLAPRHRPHTLFTPLYEQR